ncbi:hypothetical protein LP420_22060 [Massilia sp. B-10]|nr:hypothetical protein LP420_22060 [Massilia sp. B-10]
MTVAKPIVRAPKGPVAHAGNLPGEYGQGEKHRAGGQRRQPQHGHQRRLVYRHDSQPSMTTQYLSFYVRQRNLLSTDENTTKPGSVTARFRVGHEFAVTAALPEPPQPLVEQCHEMRRARQ